MIEDKCRENVLYRRNRRGSSGINDEKVSPRGIDSSRKTRMI
jgi:hypothetical protein